MKETIAIIGAGNMGQAIARGLRDKNIVGQSQLILTDSKTKNNKAVVEKADIVILSIKPQMANVILAEIKDVVQNQLIISIMAGIPIDTIQQILGKKIAVARVMPNLAAKVGKSMSVWVKSKEVSDNQKGLICQILEAIGVQTELESEDQIDKATAISGSGPAYFFYLTELLEKGAIGLGFSQVQAVLLAKQTLLGSAELLEVSTSSAEELRRTVTSKGGTTEAAIKTFEETGLQDIVEKGILTAFARAQQLGKTKEASDK